MQKAIDARVDRPIVRPMDGRPEPHDAKLISLAEDEQGEVMTRWQRTVGGMDGERGGLPETPDDLVAYKLLDAAGDAIGRRDWQGGLNILRLVVRDYGTSREAACARRVIDRLREHAGGRAR